ncbi:membrane protein insertion efficiency factor YidD [Patescibacteria group bacterium AH-259-L07]|nr:membrane protein insertion efficiency factor YidD [Patescibacteria group bacterium AH-259-L07]
MKSIVLKSIRLYQKTISPDHGIFSFFSTTISHNRYGTCKYRPTCSEYCYEAIEKYGVVKGIGRGIKRIIRCHPWSYGGWDPV